jgi:hypothetical protein
MTHINPNPNPAINIYASFIRVWWSGLGRVNDFYTATTHTACCIRRVPKMCKFISDGRAPPISCVHNAAILRSTIVIPSIDIYAGFVVRFRFAEVTETAVTFRGGRLSEAEERTVSVSVLTNQEVKIADAIKVTYRDNNNGEQKDGELHFS